MKGFAGLDPGSQGAFAVITEDRQLFTIRLSNVTEKELYEKMLALSFDYDLYCVMEHVWSQPGEGVSSAFKFGEGIGMLRGFLIALQIPFELTVPQKWQKALSIPKREIKRGEDKKELPGSETKTEFKRRLKQKAEQLFPTHKIVNENADAILIASYCKMLKTNTL